MNGRQKIYYFPEDVCGIILSFLNIKDYGQKTLRIDKFWHNLTQKERSWQSIYLKACSSKTTCMLLNSHGHKIEKINIKQMRMTREMTNTLCKLPNLHTLDLRGMWKSRVLDAKFCKLLWKTSENKLKVLLLRKTKICNQGMLYLCKLKKLAFLDIAGDNSIRARGFFQLIKLRKKIKSLSLNCCSGFNRSVLEFISQFNFTQLQTLYVGFCSDLLNYRIHNFLVDAEFMDQLSTLMIYQVRYSVEGLKYMASLKKLQFFCLCHQSHGQEHFDAMHNANFHTLWVMYGAHLTSFHVLLSMKNLKQVYFIHTSYNHTNLKRICIQKPNCKFYVVPGSWENDVGKDVDGLSPENLTVNSVIFENDSYISSL